MKRGLAFLIDLGIILLVSVLIIKLSHQVLKIQSRDLDSLVRSFSSSAYVLICLCFFNFRTFGMKVLLLNFKGVNTAEVGVFRLILFYGTLGTFFVFFLMGLVLVIQSPISLSGYLLLLVSFLNFLPRYLLRQKLFIHEIISRIEVVVETNV